LLFVDFWGKKPALFGPCREHVIGLIISHILKVVFTEMLKMGHFFGLARVENSVYQHVANLRVAQGAVA
jgi:hypothetical protein